MPTQPNNDETELNETGSPYPIDQEASLERLNQ